ncbi:MAG: hypothetical protein IKJ68_10955 [Clostridia bacterium]|nr:hypothetical protein [Clostridia bacterium]
MIFKKSTALCLIIAFVTSFFGALSFASTDVSTDANKLVILDFGNGDSSLINTTTSASGIYNLTSDFYDTGKSTSLKWTLKSGDKNIKADILHQRDSWPVGADVVFRLYNSSSSDNTISIFFYTKSTGYKPIYRKQFTVVPGWNNLVMSKKDIDNAIPAENDLMISFNSGGWSITDYEVGSVMYIDSVYCVDPAYSELASGLLKSSAAIYAGKCSAIYKNKALTLSNPPDYKDGKLFIPLSALEELFGFNLNNNSISKNDLTVCFSDGTKKAGIGNYEYILSKDSYLKNGVMYVPLSDICTIYNIPVFCDGRLAVIGLQSDIDEITYYSSNGVNPLCEEIIKILSSANGGEYTSDDCDEVIKNYLRHMVGDEIINSSENGTVKARVKSVANKATTIRNTLIKTAGSSELFEGMTSATTLDMRNTSNYIYQMARAYGTYGCELYKDKELLADLLYAVDWFYENRYGNDEAENNKSAWRDRTLYNWYDWRIGVPDNWIPTLMILKDDLTPKQIEKYLTCFDAAVPTTLSSGSNYIHLSRLIIGAAALKEDGDRIKEYALDAEKTFVYVDNGRMQESFLDAERSEYTANKGQGFYKDGSYVYHTLHAMNGTYGLPHLIKAADLVDTLSGTPFEMPSYCADNLADWLVNSFDTLIYQNRLPRMVQGRTENPESITQVRQLVSSALKCFDYFSDEDKKIIGSIIKEYTKYNRSNFETAVPFSEVVKLKQIIESNEYNNYNYNSATVFGNMDKVMQKRQEWALGVSMSSSRIFNYESINNANKNGWYLGDGMYELVLSDEGDDSTEQYWQYIDCYRLPGTTVDDQTRKAVSIAQGNEYLSSKDFVGGVEMDGKYLTAAMDLESYHNDFDFGKDNGAYGGKAPAHTNDLTAKKAYFAFDNAVYCLGSDINASNNNNANVYTVIDNRIINDALYGANGEITLSSADTAQNNVNWLNLDNKIGYYFPDNSDGLKIRKAENTLNYFQAVFDHGKNPTNGSYAYALLPNMTKEQTAAYSASPDVTVLSNTASVQAVKNNTLGITSIVFWDAGTFNGITVSQPMLVMIKESGNTLTLSVSDPTHKLTDATLKFDEIMYLASGDERITQIGIGTASTFEVDFTQTNGSSLQCEILKKEPVALDLKLTDTSGNELNRYLAHKESTVLASVSATNLSTEAKDIMFVIAMYSSDGTLQEAHTSVINVLGGRERKMQEVTLKPTSDTATIKGFVWENATIKPFSKININN